jgi:hypothetical protein
VVIAGAPIGGGYGPAEWGWASIPDVVYRGVITTSDGLPGMNSVLDPLPLFMSEPATGEPGIITDSIDPGLPVTSAGPRGVMTVDGPLEGVVCATAAPIVRVNMAAASGYLNMVYSR